MNNPKFHILVSPKRVMVHYCGYIFTVKDLPKDLHNFWQVNMK